MKPFILFTSLFNDNWDQFRSNIYGLIDDNLEFSCSIHSFINPDDIHYQKDYVKVEWSATDGDNNIGYISAFFDTKGLIKVSLYFQYEDGNIYDNVLWERT